MCGVEVLEKNLRKHRRKSHGIGAGPQPGVAKAVPGRSKPEKTKKVPDLSANGAEAWNRKVRLFREKAGRLEKEIKRLRAVASGTNAAKLRQIEAEKEEALRWIKFFAKRARESAPARKTKKGKKTKKVLSPSSGGKRDRTGKGLGVGGQALHQSFEDSSYAGRGLGHMSREHGRFGSLPLYDDYGEESGA